MDYQNLSFEEKLKLLEDIVETLDKGEAPLDELIAKYEEGMELARLCRRYLSAAEMKVIEIRKNNEAELINPDM
ncbi:MAG: xseB [Ignavibacteria bacterium]|nr:xseB [Ignavibacteria bacterium]